MVEFEERSAVTIVRMARGKGNALNLQLAAALGDALDRLERGPARAGILTGQGNIFGAGVDLPALVEGGAAYLRQFLPALDRLFERLATFPRPLVAAVNGHAIAGGAILMLACDQRLLARGPARVGLTEVQVGVLFPAWALEIARFATPPQHYPTLILTGRTWSPEEALARGLVDELLEPSELLDRACAVATELAAIPANVYASDEDGRSAADDRGWPAAGDADRGGGPRTLVLGRDAGPGRGLCGEGDQTAGVMAGGEESHGIGVYNTGRSCA